jgi:hypothetical protein
MKIDIKQIGTVPDLLPWDLVLTFDGIDYPTRRCTVGEIGTLEQMAGRTNRDGMEAVQRIIFEDPKPDMSGWEGEWVTAALLAYLTYFNGRLAKNSRSIAAAAKSAIDQATPAAATTQQG